MIFKIGSLNQKQTLAVLAIVIGLILIVFAVNGMHKAEHAKSSIDKFSGFFTNATGIWNPVIKFFGGEARTRASKYDSTLTTLLVVGTLMVISGIWGAFYYRKR